MLGVTLLLGICVVSTIGIARALRHMDRKAERARKTMFAAGRLGPRTVVPVYRIHHDFDGGPCVYHTTHMDSGRPVREAA